MLSLFDSLTEDLDEVAHDALREAMRRLKVRVEPRIEWKNYRVTAGRAYMRDNLICLSKRILDTPAKVRETVIHEYAHLYVFERYGPAARPHGREWRKVMQLFGLRPDAFHAYDCERNSMTPKFFLVCERCGESFGRVRPLKRFRAYFHVGCGGRLSRKKRETQ